MTTTTTTTTTATTATTALAHKIANKSQKLEGFKFLIMRNGILLSIALLVVACACVQVIISLRIFSLKRPGCLRR